MRASLTIRVALALSIYFLKPSYTAPHYRNQLLAETMAKFNMIDTVQMGIQKMFRIQKERYFPLPDYDLATPQKVAVKVYGKVLDENYSRVLFDHPEFDLETVFLIDRGQSDQYYRQMILDYLTQWRKGTKADFVKLLGDRLDPLEK